MPGAGEPVTGVQARWTDKPPSLARRPTIVLRKNYRRDLERAKLTNLKEETKNKRHPSMMKFCLLWLNLLADLLRFLVLGLRSKSSLAAENLFLRKQLAFYQERKIKPRRTSHPTRLPSCGSAAGSIGEAH
jgi:hypothetical protein